ncbi:hypothetical protein AVEN_201044-1 [Araneus ventricosus]|uniref:Uncharacterized protein n=1 Tax=Araneus ventricosus TaxID=182803 RepID=A0A4Y2V581_ARAVE|nr:hypothetical protein AVEN_201044-1 [Araneus ventricosus]
MFSTLIFSNTNSQQITNNDNNSTFNSAQLTSFLARTADETLKSFQWINTTPSDPNAVLIYSLRQAVTSHGVFSYIQAYFLFLIEISRKGSHFLESSICRQDGQICRQGRGPRMAAARHSMLTPVKLPPQL